MLATNDSESQLALKGVDQQDFNELQRVSGAYPYQEGLQRRIPGKSIIQIYNEPIGSIFVFYNVFGRTYTFVDFGDIEITEIGIPPIFIPAIPPATLRWFDSFGSYLVDTISRLWPAGIWLVGVGVTETIIEGVIDYFLVDPLAPSDSINTDEMAHEAPPVDTPPVTPIPPPTGPQYPVDCADLPVGMNYQVLSTATYFHNIQRQGGSYDSGEYQPQDLPFPAYHDHPYVDIAGTSLTGAESSIRQSYYNGFNNVSRSRSTGYYTVVDFDFNEVEFPLDVQFWLVGTKELSTGVGGLTPVLQTTCAALQLSTVGERTGNIVISSTRGINTTDLPNTTADQGTTAYTELRAYSSEF